MFADWFFEEWGGGCSSAGRGAGIGSARLIKSVPRRGGALRKGKDEVTFW